MQNVSRFEASLLRLLYYFLRQEPVERALPLIENRTEAPPCLSPGAVRLVKEALTKGCVFQLAHRGGWRDERHLRQLKVVSGRLWERTPPEQLGLTFSAHSMRFLMWITSARPGDKQPHWQPEHDQLTHGDLMLLFFAHEGLRDTVDSLGAPTLRKRAPYMSHALCWLAYPEDYAQTPEEAVPQFKPWIDGVGACILEALQPELLNRWIHVESSKERIEQPPVMRALGVAQDRVLNTFLSTLEKVNRRDLARFLLIAANRLLTAHAHAGMWTGALQMSGQRLADRAATYQGATSLLRHLDKLAEWARWARSVRHFDEEYRAAQLYLSDWEAYDGDTLVNRAHAIIRALDPMRQAVQAGGATTTTTSPPAAAAP